MYNVQSQKVPNMYMKLNLIFEWNPKVLEFENLCQNQNQNHKA
jgi:hypothetical protein